MKKATVFCAALITIAATSTYALTDAQNATVKKAFVKVKATEMAAKAAKLVQQAPAADRTEMAVAVTRAAIAKNPNVASSVVSAVCAVAPEASPAVSAAASSMLNSHAEAIAVAAASAAPNYRIPIVDSVSTAVPSAAPQVSAKVEAAVAAKTRVSGNSAISPTGPTISINSGPIRGVQATPVVPPASIPTAQIVNGWDPKRYSTP